MSRAGPELHHVLSAYPIDGRPLLELVVAQHIGDDLIGVRVLADIDATDALRLRIGAAAEIFNSHRIR